jgi:hypothetical protein
MCALRLFRHFLGHCTVQDRKCVLPISTNIVPASENLSISTVIGLDVVFDI